MDGVIALVNRANQRGGRMLSVVDLVEAGTLTLAQAAWLVGRVQAGASWLVGARPGGAGKTTVMAALLAMVPPRSVLRLTGRGGGWQAAEAGEYLVAYELSPGYYDAYIWGAEVARFFALGAGGCRLVSNLHADTLEEARRQVVAECGAGSGDFNAAETFIPIRVEPAAGLRPVVDRVHVFDRSGWRTVSRDSRLPGGADAEAEFLKRCLAEGLRRVERVRAAWLDWSRRGQPGKRRPPL